MTYRQLLLLCLVAGFIAGYTTHRSSWQEPATLAEIYARQLRAAMGPRMIDRREIIERTEARARARGGEDLAARRSGSGERG